MKKARILALAGLTVTAALTLSACGSSDPLGSATSGGDSTGSGDAIVVGSQQYYSNEIIAEIYAQALEGAGLTVQRKFNIGQRDAYLPSLESGTVTVFPEYTGNLLQALDPKTTATSSDDVYAALRQALPSTLIALEQSTATDQDSYTVTRKFATENALTTIEDLKKVKGLTLGGRTELEQRPYGPMGLKSVYGVDVKFSATADTTVDELIAGTIQVGNVFTADPRIKTDNLVPLEDTKHMLLASNVVPIVNAKVADQVAAVLNPVSAKLTPEGLIELNVQSTKDKKSSADIAKAWLAANALK